MSGERRLKDDGTFAVDSYDGKGLLWADDPSAPDCCCFTPGNCYACGADLKSFSVTFADYSSVPFICSTFGGFFGNDDINYRGIQGNINGTYCLEFVDNATFTDNAGKTYQTCVYEFYNSHSDDFWIGEPQTSSLPITPMAVDTGGAFRQLRITMVIYWPKVPGFPADISIKATLANSTISSVVYGVLLNTIQPVTYNPGEWDNGTQISGGYMGTGAIPIPDGGGAYQKYVTPTTHEHFTHGCTDTVSWTSLVSDPKDEAMGYVQPNNHTDDLWGIPWAGFAYGGTIEATPSTDDCPSIMMKPKIERPGLAAIRESKAARIAKPCGCGK